MGYQSVSTPRFFINLPEWANSVGNTIPWGSNTTGNITTGWGGTGAASSIAQHFRTLPVTPSGIGTASLWMDSLQSISIDTGEGFVAFLGHTFASGKIKPTFNNEFPVTPPSPSLPGTPTDFTDIVNSDPFNGYDGFSIMKFGWGSFSTGIHIVFRDGDTNSTTSNAVVGSIIIGSYFTMSHPDLSLTLGYETGTKTIETRGGASISNTMWKPPMWGSLGPWELSVKGSSTENQSLAHSSRRTWSLSFSYLDKTNTFPKYNALNRLVDQNDTLPDNETLLTSDDFFSQVWNRVGTALPFIFQPDKDVPEFAICKFTNNISFQQQAPGLFRISLKIREVW